MPVPLTSDAFQMVPALSKFNHPPPKPPPADPAIRATLDRLSQPPTWGNTLFAWYCDAYAVVGNCVHSLASFGHDIYTDLPDNPMDAVLH